MDLPKYRVVARDLLLFPIGGLELDSQLEELKGLGFQPEEIGIEVVRFAN